MKALREAPPGDSAARARLVDEAAHAVWCYFVMREAIGIYRHQPAIEVYGLTNEVMARVGAVRTLPSLP